jgi:hypothetical protein
MISSSSVHKNVLPSIVIKESTRNEVIKIMSYAIALLEYHNY